MSIYTMNNLWIRQGVCDKLDATIRHFIWGGEDNHWVKYDKVSTPLGNGGLGLRNARNVNTSMLGKHVWDTINNIDKLWVRLLSSKYMSDSQIFGDIDCKCASYTLRSMVQAANIMKPGYITCVGEGDISLWYEKWLNKGRISDRIPYVDIHDINLRIKDIFINGSWNFNMLYTQIPEDIMLEMQSIFVNPNSTDTLIWNSSPTGEYSTKNAYLWLSNLSISNLQVNGGEISWKWIWRLKVPENVKHFSWLIMHGSLPTNSFRFMRHTTQDHSCHRCGATNETLLHTLRDCNKAHQIWCLLGFMTLQDFNTEDHCLWFHTNATGKYGTLFTLSCWIIWKARNEEVFNDIRWDNWRVVSRIHSLLDVTVKAFPTSTSHKDPRLVTWVPPPENFIKLNVDGSSFGNPGRSGFGGLFRDHNGNWLMGFSGGCGFTTNINAELQAIAQGLTIASQNGYLKLVCESDSKTALDLINDGVSSVHPYAPIVDYIRSFLAYDWQLSFTHSLREGNSCADWLAKHGSSMDYGVHHWRLCPLAISTSLQADAIGIVRLRP